MAVPPEQRFKFFVYHLESPSAPDLYHGRSEADMLRRAVGLNQIHCVTRTVISREAFEAGLKIGLPDEMQKQGDRFPVVHISAHGDQDGIELSNGDRLSWEEMRHVLAPVNEALKGGLLLCMSCCQGYSGARMAMYPDEQFPFFAIVGSGSSPTWSDAAIAFATFYHLIAKGEYVTDAVAAMCTASGCADFFYQTAVDARRGFLDYLATLNSGSVRAELQQGSNDIEPGELAKLKAVTA